jgi:hypothetical protein
MIDVEYSQNCNCIKCIPIKSTVPKALIVSARLLLTLTLKSVQFTKQLEVKSNRAETISALGTVLLIGIHFIQLQF